MYVAGVLVQLVFTATCTEGAGVMSIGQPISNALVLEIAADDPPVFPAFEDLIFRYSVRGYANFDGLYTVTIQARDTFGQPMETEVAVEVIRTGFFF